MDEHPYNRPLNRYTQRDDHRPTHKNDMFYVLTHKDLSELLLWTGRKWTP